MDAVERAESKPFPVRSNMKVLLDRGPDGQVRMTALVTDPPPEPYVPEKVPIAPRPTTLAAEIRARRRKLRTAELAEMVGGFLDHRLGSGYGLDEPGLYDALEEYTVDYSDWSTADASGSARGSPDVSDGP